MVAVPRIVADNVNGALVAAHENSLLQLSKLGFDAASTDRMVNLHRENTSPFPLIGAGEAALQWARAGSEIFSAAPAATGIVLDSTKRTIV